MSNSQELLDTALRHCHAIQAVIDDLAAKGAHTELRLLANRLQRLAFRSTPNTPANEPANLSATGAREPQRASRR
jgi:hypothetical protein